MTTYHLLLFVFGASLSVLSAASGRSAQVRTTNVNAAYKIWNRARIPYYIDPAFSTTEGNLIRTAIAQVAGALPAINASAPCLNFVEIPSTNQEFKIRFTPLTGPLGATGTQAQTYCYSFPGISVATQQTALEQVVSLARPTATGCMQTSCQIQKYIALLLGKRNEHQRGDRNTYITMNTAALQVPSAYTLYVNLVDAFWGLYPYDYCSITHNRQTDFAYPGQLAFTLPSTAPFTTVPSLCTLSLTDCRLISMLYGCPMNGCTQATCALQGQSTTTLPTTTTATTTTTTAVPCNVNFCTAAINDGAYLLDGRQVIFSGNCFAVVTAAGAVTAPTTGGAIIATIFPGVVGPVQAVWATGSPTLTTQHVLLPNGNQFACTGTTAPFTCALETPGKTPTNPAAVFESVIAASQPNTVWTVISGSATFSQDPSGTAVPMGNVQCPSCCAGAGPPCATTMTSWSGAWYTGTDNTVAVLGKDASGAGRIQYMKYNAIPGFSYWSFNADAALYCPPAG